MGKKETEKKEVVDHQQEFELDPVFPLDLSKVKDLAAKIKAEIPTAPIEYSEIYETMCGAIDDSQPVEQYDGTLGVTTGFVDTHQGPVGQLQWNDNLATVYDNPGNVSGVRWCTGTMISDNLFLSAGHCFDLTGGGWQRPRINGTTNLIPSDEIARNMHVNFNYQIDPSGTLRVEQSFAVLQLVEYRLGGLDFAVVRLAGNPGSTYGVAQVSTADAAQGDTICIIGHPAGRPKRIEAGPVSDFQGDRIRYNDIDTLGGNSGSGILRETDGRIVGIHTNGGCNATMTGHNFGLRITAIIQQSPTLQNITQPKLKFSDDGGTLKFFDDGGKLKFMDDRGTLKFSDDRGTLKFIDDGGTLKFMDDGGTLKQIDDVKQPFLDKQPGADLAKQPGADWFDPGTFRRRPMFNPGRVARRVQPFVLATPHHSLAWAEGGGVSQTANDEAEIRAAYESALGELEAMLGQTMEQIDALDAEYRQLLEEYETVFGRSSAHSAPQS